MNEDILVSIIVPAYNVEKYLSQCLDSILRQTYKNIEILVLNDGSTDNTLSIAESYAMTDSRIKVYSHENRGLGPTRNRGLQLISGKYVSFVDSDDYIADDMINWLLSKAVKTNADIVQGENVWFWENENRTQTFAELKNIQGIKVSEKNKECFYKYYYFSRIISHNACDKLYKVDYVLKHNICFGDNRKVFAEDNYFQLQNFLYNPHIEFVPEHCYFYRQQQNSIMHTPKANLLQRHNQMMIDYDNWISPLGEGCIEEKVASIVSIDVLIMEVLNQINFGGTINSYMKALSNMDSTLICRNIKSICLKRAYKLILDKKKRLYVICIGLLYAFNMKKLAHFITWYLYKR